MNGAALTLLAASRSVLTADEEKELRQLEETFPWFALPRILLTRHYRFSNHYRFENRLKESALYVLDRERLYHLLHESEAKLQPDKAAESLAETSIRETPVIELETPQEYQEVAHTIDEKPEHAADFTPPEAPIEAVAETSTPEESLSFTDWLNRISPDHSEREVPPLPALETVQAEEVQTTDAVIQEAQASKQEALSIDEILNRFIEVNPSISRPKAEFFNPIKMAQDSLEEDENLVSETLVKIYLKQKHYKKAIKALEKLRLLYPAKSDSFAAQIKEIKETYSIQ